MARTVRIPVPFERAVIVPATDADRAAAIGQVWEIIDLDELGEADRLHRSLVYCRVSSPGRPDLWREYQVRAATRLTALARVVECVCRNRATVTVFDWVAPPGTETLAQLDRCNAKLRAERDYPSAGNRMKGMS